MDFTELIDLASEKVGGAVLFANDDFFAPKENLLKAGAPVFIEGKYTDRGKWMDGWESRRRRTPGFDWAIIRLGLPGIVRGIIVDTSFFRGNFPEHCSLEAATLDGLPTESELLDPSVNWVSILPQMPLAGDLHNPFAVNYNQRVTHLRFAIYPDGGVARLRVYGEVLPDWERLRRLGGHVDVAALFEPRVPGRAHAGELCDFFPAQPRRAATPEIDHPDLLGRKSLPSAAEKLGQLGPPQARRILGHRGSDHCRHRQPPKLVDLPPV